MTRKAKIDPQDVLATFMKPMYYYEKRHDNEPLYSINATME